MFDTGDCTQCNNTERLLRSACIALQKLGYDFNENPALWFWWKEYQENLLKVRSK